MPTDENQKNAFEFLREHLETQQPFTRADFAAATDWGESSLRTYLSKQFKPFIVPAGAEKFRVSEAFRRFATWERFQQHVTQVRRVAADYRRTEYENVLIFEFFMPLTNEEPLRATLDALFYKDTILARLRTMDRAKLEGHFPREERESGDAYLERLCQWISERFVGYSISHVSGRFRGEALCTRAEATTIQTKGGRYLLDETTAVTRFIFPCEDDQQPKKVRFFFEALFVESIIQVVNGENEIWMVESGMRNRLHTWKVTS